MRRDFSVPRDAPRPFAAPVLSGDGNNRSASQGFERDGDLGALTRLQHVAFVRAAYGAVLRRNPLPDEERGMLGSLASGESKIRLLGDLRYSPEGRGRGARIRTLPLRYFIERLFRVPFVGRVLEAIAVAIRLPALVRHHRSLEFAVAAHRTDLATMIEALVQSTGEALASQVTTHELTRESLTRLAQGVELTRENLARFADAVEHEVTDVAAQLERLHERLLQHAEVEPGLTGEASSFYADLEDAFRGARDEIKARLATYVPTLMQGGIGGEEYPVLDLGCGRGEWLEVLKENGLRARGVDIRADFCASCVARGLDVVQQDAIACVAALPEASVGAITGFHIAEHLPFDVLLRLVAQCARVLRPGGLLILETPDPSNLLVSTNTFYLDPTHNKPLPSALLKFVLETAGFTAVEIIGLHASPHQWADLTSEMDRYLAVNFFAGQDYAVIGRRAETGAMPGDATRHA